MFSKSKDKGILKKQQNKNNNKVQHQTKGIQKQKNDYKKSKSKIQIKKQSIKQIKIQNQINIQKNKQQKIIPKPNLPPKKNIISKEKQIITKKTWSNISLNILLGISQYYSSNVFDVYRLSLVCSVWRSHMNCQNGKYFWNRFKKTENILNFFQFKKYLFGEVQQIKQKKSLQFQTIFTKLFNYGSTKQNIPNKLINKLNLQLNVTINKKTYKNYTHKLRQFNFSSYLYSKILQINQLTFNMYSPHNMFKDNLQITIQFYSRAYKVAYKLQYKFKPQDIIELAIKQKAFNYYLDKNLVITYFQGDKQFLYAFIQISVLQLINQFRKIIKNNYKQYIANKTKKLPLYKKLCQTQFENFIQYIKFQADFQLHMSYHNSVKQIFTHCDTKVYPVQYNQKFAYFQIKVNDTFQKTSTFLLDNKMGMSQKIDNLFLLDLILKDRDRFLFVFSGFIYARKATLKQRQSLQNYFQFNQCQIRILQFKTKKFDFHITIIEETKKNLIKNIKLHLLP